MLLMALYSVRSERQLCEQIDLNLLFRWFLDLQPSEDAFDASTFSKNRQRLETHGLTQAFFDAVVAEALAKNLCSEHFSVDGTLIESFASAKSFQPKQEQDEPSKKQPPSDGNGFKPSNPDVDFHGQQRTNATHASQTDPEARLYRKGRGKEAKLSHLGHVLNENRHGLILRVAVTEANGQAERQAATDMLDDLKAKHQRVPKTMGADKGYDDGEFFQELEDRQIEPHIPLVREPAKLKTVRHQKRHPGIRARQRMKQRLKTEGYSLSQKCRKKIEECFGWLKSVAGMDRSRVVGRWKLRQLLEVSAAAFNLVRMRRLAPIA
jgi:IS5 family transposase